ncbi:MAG: hypothetical protein K0S71_2461 [Clostridia bacterium]|nr:hypothetical protein [Clostridia bacterium]
MKHTKAFMMILLIIGLIIQTSAVYAAGEKVQITQTFVKEGKLDVFLNYIDESNMPAASEVSSIEATLGDNKLKVNKQTRLQDAKAELSNSMMILVDISKSFKAADKEKTLTVISSILENSFPNTEFALVTFGSEVVVKQDFTQDRFAFAKALEKVEMNDKKTNLYTALVKAAEIYHQKDIQPKEKCQILVISDGQEYDETGLTKDEVYLKLKSANLPVYTLGMYNERTGESGKENIKVLSSFARVTGGLDTVLGMDKKTEEEVADLITKHINGSFAAELDVGAIKADGKEYFLDLKIKSGEKVVSAEGVNVRMDVSAEEGAKPEEPSKTETAPKKEETPKNESPSKPSKENVKPEDNQKNRMILIGSVVGGAALIVMIVIIIIVLNIRKKSKQKVLTEQKSEQGNQQEISQEDKTVQLTTQKAAENIAAPDQTLEAERKAIKLTKLGADLSKGTVEVAIRDAFTIGRSNGRNDLVILNDEAISSVHCKLYVASGSIYIEDLGSTNGTYVNGIPISYPIKLNSDDIILMGTSEYRITF